MIKFIFGVVIGSIATVAAEALAVWGLIIKGWK